jgi:hypothetical protein
MGFQWFVRDKFCGWVSQDLTLPDGLTTEASSVSSLEGAETLLDCKLRNIYRAPLRRGDQALSCFFYFFRHNSLRQALGSGPPFHVLKMSEILREQGFASLEVLAALRPNRQILKWNSLLIASEIHSVSELPSAGTHVYQIHKWIEFDQGIATELARELARFHDCSFFHGDLKSRHILTRTNSTASSGEDTTRFVLVDLEKTQRLPHLPSPARDILAARDLIQLLCSLPAGTELDEVQQARDRLLDEYLTRRSISSRRARFIGRILEMYGPAGFLVQGKTVLGGLTSHLRRKSPK